MRGLLAALLLAALALPTPASGLEKRIVLEPGDSLETLASRLYGDTKAAAVLRRHNDLGDRPQAGKEIRAPYSEQRKVRRGETWTSLAREIWGDGGLAGDFARMVAGSSNARLIAGRRIAVPVFVEDRLGKGQTLAALSRRYYGSSEKADLLMRVNGIKNPRRLRVGARIRVPVVLREPEVVATRAPEPTSPTPVEPAEKKPDVAAAPEPSADPAFQKPLREAINTYLDGSYDRALFELEELRPEVLAHGDRHEQSLLLQHLVYVYVAFDRPDRACETFGALRTVDPEVRFDADLVSPKIRQLVSRCRD